MNLLAAAVPGLREVRGPLIAGYLWLLVAWLVVKPEPDLADATGLLASVVDLADTVGPVATAAGVSVAAYLIGALQQGLIGLFQNLHGNSAELIRVWLRQARERQEYDKKFKPEGSGLRGHWRARYVRADAIETQLRESLANMRDSLEPEALADRPQPHPTRAAFHGLWKMLPKPRRRQPGPSRATAGMRERRQEDVDELSNLLAALHSDPDRVKKRMHYLVVSHLPSDNFPKAREAARRLEQVLPNINSRRYGEIFRDLDDLKEDFWKELSRPQSLLLGTKPELFAEADRLKAEADFRTAVVPPMYGLIVLLAANVSGWCLALIVAPYVLGRQAEVNGGRAFSLVLDAVTQRKVPSPALERLEEYVKELDEDATTQPPIAPGPSA